MVSTMWQSSVALRFFAVSLFSRPVTAFAVVIPYLFPCRPRVSPRSTTPKHPSNGRLERSAANCPCMVGTINPTGLPDNDPSNVDKLPTDSPEEPLNLGLPKLIVSAGQRDSPQNVSCSGWRSMYSPLLVQLAIIRLLFANQLQCPRGKLVYRDGR